MAHWATRLPRFSRRRAVCGLGPGSLEIRAAPASFSPTFLSAVTATPRTPEIRNASRHAALVVVVLIRATTLCAH
jgi:hypothetical protein